MLLLERGAAVDQGCTESTLDMTPLVVAATNGHTSACAVLIEHGADFTSVDYDGMTPLATAAYRGHHDVCALLCRAG